MFLFTRLRGLFSPQQSRRFLGIWLEASRPARQLYYDIRCQLVSTWETYIAELDMWNDEVSGLADGFRVANIPLPNEPTI